MRISILAVLLVVLGQIIYWKFVIGPAGAVTADTELPVEPVTVVSGLANPWAVAFLPSGDVLITERPGRLRLVRDGKLLAEPISGLPEIVSGGQGGLMDVVLHPRFAENRRVYLSYTAPGEDGGRGTAVGRGRLSDMALTDFEVIYRMKEMTGASQHFGSRLVFADDGTLYVTTGDRGDRHRAQDATDTAGSLLRITDDGGAPADNPWASGDGADPRLFSYGHRNIQGAVLHPATRRLWMHEHGPQGGDELNISVRGANYGWPVITYGREYGIGLPIGEGTERDDIEPPIHYWVPSIAPSGMAFYTGEKIPQWRGDLFIGSLKFGLLVRLKLDGAKVIAEERMLQGIGRVREVRDGPDGYLYLLTDDSRDGRLIRLEPRGN